MQRPALTPRQALAWAFVAFAVSSVLDYGLQTLGAWNWVSHLVTFSSFWFILIGIDRRSAKRTRELGLGPRD